MPRFEQQSDGIAENKNIKGASGTDTCALFLKVDSIIDKARAEIDLAAGRRYTDLQQVDFMDLEFGEILLLVLVFYDGLHVYPKSLCRKDPMALLRTPLEALRASLRIYSDEYSGSMTG